MPSSTRSACWLLAASLGLPAVQAQTNQPTQPCPTAPARPRLLGTQIVVENDVFGRGKTDRWYTNGLRGTTTYLEPTQGDDPLSAWVAQGGDAFIGAAVDRQSCGGARAVSWTLGQNIYTPRDIRNPAPQPDDRPWAGWLYAGVTLQGYSGQAFQQTDLKLGWTGPSAGAGAVQRWFHRVIDSPYPAGWEQQLKTRLGVQASHLRLWRSGDSSKQDWFGFHYGGGATVGTLRSYATAMAGVVFGRLDGDNPVFALGNDGDQVIQDFGSRQAFERPLLFVNASATGVAANQFLTGSTPYGRSQIQLKPWVVAWQWGVLIPLGKDKRLLFAQNARTAEFTSASVRGNEGVQRWGTFTFNVDH